ncbi:MAG TPA: type III-B CRISPR module RAMP protein Cmr6 [Planctomycetota bacterium]|nr:type III-B CRISPR module RAMP protein Cmr6 [Planctomycetota bacterium]
MLLALCVPRDAADALRVQQLPVERWAEEVVRRAGPPANLGLLFQRWMPLRPPDRTLKNSKGNLLRQMAEQSGAADQSLLREIHRRLDAALESLRSLGAAVVSESAVLTSRLVSRLGEPHALETGFMFHPLYGVPYLPGSGIKGAVRAVVHPQDKKLAETLFGTQEKAGRVIFFDAFPLTCRLEVDYLTPHYKEYYPEGKRWSTDDQGPNPVPFLSVPARVEWRFRAAVLPARGSDLEPAESLGARLRSALGEALKDRGLGAKKTAGYGVFQIGTAETAAAAPRRESAPSLPAPSLKRGDRVEVELREKNPKKGTWKVCHLASGRIGFIVNSKDAPGDWTAGQRVFVLVDSVSSQEGGNINFRWVPPGPSAPAAGKKGTS